MDAQAIVSNPKARARVAAIATGRSLKEKVGFPSVRVESEFLKPLRYGERIRVDLELLDIGRTSITVGYTLVRLSDGAISARATIKNVAIDNDSFKPVPISDAWRNRFEKFKRA